MGASPSPSPEVDNIDIAIGSVLDGRYRIDAVLGAGGMGRVYRAEHTGIGRSVAIKVLRSDLNRNGEAAQRFQREAIASGRLDHPNIVGVSDFGIADTGPCYLVMEALEGEALGARLERDKRLPWREAIQIVRGVLRGLSHAHDRGVVHRDIKPDNVFLARKDAEVIVKILDFGIAKLYAGSPDDPASTRAGLTVGTPAYLSPEQAVGGEIKPASDLYSTTVLLFEMIAGRAPFEETDPLAMLGAHVGREPPRISEIAPDVEVPASLEALLQHGLAKSSKDRISSAAAYLAGLDQVLAEHPEPPAGGALGLAATAAHTSYPTPPPGTLSPSYATPPPGTLSPISVASGAMTPMPGAAFHHTPVPGTPFPSPALPTSTRAISLADAPPLPRNWLKIGAVVIALGILIAIVAAISTRSAPATPTKDKKGAAAKRDRDPPRHPKPRPEATVPTPEPILEPPPPPLSESLPAMVADPETTTEDTALKALVYDLERGKTCGDRKAAIGKLVELGDPAAIPHLKRAKHRQRGGLMGIGGKNANQCLKKAADAAIKKLKR